MLNVTYNTFVENVLNSKLPVLAYFWAEWCFPCKALAPILEGLAAEYADKFSIVKINTDEEIKLAQEHDIMAVPTLILFVNGKEVLVMSGGKNKPMLMKELKKHIAF